MFDGVRGGHLSCDWVQNTDPLRLERRTTMTKSCLYCGGPQLPESAEFCSACGRPLESAIRFEYAGKMRNTTRMNGCLYCGGPLPESAETCPECGRPRERSGVVRRTQEEKIERPKGMDGTGDTPHYRGFLPSLRDPHADPESFPKRGMLMAGENLHAHGMLFSRELLSFQSKRTIRFRARSIQRASPHRRRARKG